MTNADNIFDSLKTDANGLVAAVVQDAANGEVLMVAWMDREALKRTLEEGKTCFFSRSRQKYWVKGETSGHYQVVKEVRADCDLDAILVKVEQTGAACHAGYRSCFYRKVDSGGKLETVEEQLKRPEDIYKTP
ncbi:MAG: phosphoribosyl-AMP cyclohydrolase [Armatimonadetes bacterium]|nr:phosphoribosyl-AMP cyclohydrolase [Armatimonadota bacterium]